MRQAKAGDDSRYACKAANMAGHPSVLLKRYEKAHDFATYGLDDIVEPLLFLKELSEAGSELFPLQAISMAHNICRLARVGPSDGREPLRLGRFGRWGRSKLPTSLSVRPPHCLSSQV